MRTPDPRVQLKKSLLVLAKDLSAIRKRGMKEQLDSDSARALTGYVRALHLLTTQHDEDAEKIRQKFVGSSVAEVEAELLKMVAASPVLAAKMRVALQPKEATPCSPPAASPGPSSDET
jgi:hypothetical protein